MLLKTLYERRANLRVIVYPEQIPRREAHDLSTAVGDVARVSPEAHAKVSV